MTRRKAIGWCLSLMMLVLAMMIVACESAAIMPPEAPRYATAVPAAGRGAPRGSAPGGELWIVPLDQARRSTLPATAPAEQGMPMPGSPMLAARRPDGRLVPIPLKHTAISATISGYIASVGVAQVFTNPYSEKIEAVYVFPLPEHAAINDFVMTIGERHIRGIIRERAEAEKIYRAAKAQGYVASLMMQERPNIFTQNVANIEPGKQIDIDIRYFHTLTYQDGWFEWSFPMVIGPRYNPAESTGGVGAVARDGRGISGQKAAVQYVQPEKRNGHDISLQVQLDAGMKVEELVCVNHKVRLLDGKENRTVVQLDAANALPNKDFALRYKLAGEKVKTGLLVEREKGGGGYFTLMVVPPADLARHEPGISPLAMSNVKINFGGLKVTDIYPQRIPDLFVGRPIIVTGRFTGAPAGDITVTGRVGGRNLTFNLPVGAAVEENPAIAGVWARMRIADLYDEAIYEGRDVVKEVKETALAYGLMSEFTSFVSIDSTHKTEGDDEMAVVVPVPAPGGVRYDTTIQEMPVRGEK